MKRFLMFFIVFMGLVSFSSAEFELGTTYSAKQSTSVSMPDIAGYTASRIYTIGRQYLYEGNTNYEDAYNQLLEDIVNAGYGYITTSVGRINIFKNIDFAKYNETGFLYYIKKDEGDCLMYCVGNSSSKGTYYTDSNCQYIAVGETIVSSTVSIKKFVSSANLRWDGDYVLEVNNEPDEPVIDYSSDLAGLISAITTSDVIKDNKIHGRDEFFIIPYGSVSGKNLYDIYFYGDYLSLSAFEYLGSDGNLYYDLNKTIDNGLASFIANIWGEEKVKGSYFSALYDTETGNIDVVYNGSFLFSSYDMQGFSSELNPIIYTTKDIPYYYYEKDETTGEWIAIADESKNIVNEVITDSEGNEISTEIVGSSDSVANTPWNRFVNVILSIPESILAGIKKLFIPDLSYLQGTLENLKNKLGFITQARDIVEDITNGIELNPTAPPSIKIDLTNANSKYNWGTEALCIDLAWYAPFKPAVDFLIICFAYGFFFWNLYREIPNIINGVSGSGVFNSYDNKSGKGK